MILFVLLLLLLRLLRALSGFGLRGFAQWFFKWAFFYMGAFCTQAFFWDYWYTTAQTITIYRSPEPLQNSNGQNPVVERRPLP